MIFGQIYKLDADWVWIEETQQLGNSKTGKVNMAS